MKTHFGFREFWMEIDPEAKLTLLAVELLYADYLAGLEEK